MKTISKIKIGFISTIDSDNYIFEKVYKEVHKQEIYYKNFKEVDIYVS